MSFTDCEDCENYENEDECLGCIHYDDWVDKFIPISMEKRLEIAKKHKDEFLSRIPKEEISIELPTDFMDCLKMAWKFVPSIERENEKVFCVYCNQDNLIATDQYRVVKIYTNCPIDLVSKHLVWDEMDNKLYARTDDFVSVLSDGKDQELFDKTDGVRIVGFKAEMPFVDITPKELTDGENHLTLPNDTICLRKKYIVQALECVPDNEEIVITYKGVLDPIRITAKGFDTLILPVRR